MNGMPENRRSQRIDWTTRFQLQGILLKKPLGLSSGRWQKRFFIIKDGFLLYYTENEKKELEKRQYFNTHPKGTIPLNNCVICSGSEQGQPFAIVIDSDEIEGRFIMAADNEYERDRWLNILQQSQRVTWRNAELSDAMITQLENQGLSLAKERQEYFNQLQSETNALSDEKERTEELEKINQELEKEKTKMESWTQEIKEEYDRIKEEQESTLTVMREVEEDRTALSQTLDHQQELLQKLDSEKEVIVSQLKERDHVTKRLSMENKSLSQTSGDLQGRLQQIECRTSKIQHEKSEAEQQLMVNEEKLKQLEEEKSYFNEHAHELRSTIDDLIAQKEVTENELREEVKARLSAERKLKDAENSLMKIDLTVNDTHSNIKEEVREKIDVDVKKLKRFFEDLVAESTFDADKPLLMKNMIHARKTMAKRAKTLKFEKRRRASSNEDSALRAKRNIPKRRAATTVIKPGQLSKIMASPDTTNAKDAFF